MVLPDTPALTTGPPTPWSKALQAASREPRQLSGTALVLRDVRVGPGGLGFSRAVLLALFLFVF